MFYIAHEYFLCVSLILPTTPRQDNETKMNETDLGLYPNSTTGCVILCKSPNPSELQFSYLKKGTIIHTWLGYCGE